MVFPHIKKLERIQRIATKIMPELNGLKHKERLREMQLMTLEERRQRGHLFAIYKLVNQRERVDS